MLVHQYVKGTVSSECLDTSGLKHDFFYSVRTRREKDVDAGWKSL